MPLPLRLLILAGVAPVLLQACVAAVVPVAASGLIARHHRHARAAATAAPPAPVLAARVDPSPEPVPVPTAGGAPSPAAALPPVPRRLADMKPGTLYAGSIPTGPAATTPAVPRLPDPAIPEEMPTPAAAVSRPRQDWHDLVRYVASHYADRSADSALMERGSTAAAPRWVPCGDKTPAVLVDLDATLSARGTVAPAIADLLGGLEVLQIAIVYTTRAPAPALATALARFPARDLHLPVAGQTLFPVVAGREPAARARIASLYCVVAIAGDVPEDFPAQSADTAAHGPWNRGWFLVAPPARS